MHSGVFDFSDNYTAWSCLAQCFWLNLQGVHKEKMNAGEYPVIGATEEYTMPGLYTLQVFLKLYLCCVIMF